MPKPKDKSVVNLEECANFTVTFEVLFEKVIDILERQRKEKIQRILDEHDDPMKMLLHS